LLGVTFAPVPVAGAFVLNRSLLLLLNAGINNGLRNDMCSCACVLNAKRVSIVW
jgi:hypothetical protein